MYVANVMCLYIYPCIPWMKHNFTVNRKEWKYLNSIKGPMAQCTHPLRLYKRKTHVNFKGDRRGFVCPMSGKKTSNHTKSYSWGCGWMFEFVRTAFKHFSSTAWNAYTQWQFQRHGSICIGLSVNSENKLPLSLVINSPLAI